MPALPAYDVVHRSLPDHSGVVDLAGLQASVEILRDEQRGAHIFAADMHNLFFAQRGTFRLKIADGRWSRGGTRQAVGCASWS